MIAVLRALLEGQARPLAVGGLLALLVLSSGVALLGLSGWFITAAAAAGLAGAGLVFDVFSPAAGVRMLAITRTAARYGERLASHDAVLRALAALRVRLIAAQARAPWEALNRLRSAEALNRLGADVEALDGLLLRLILPLGAAVLTLAGTFAALWLLVGLPLAMLVAGGLAAGGALVYVLGARAARRPSAALETATQHLRRGIVETLGAREALAVAGRLQARRAAIEAQDAERQGLARRLDRIERRAAAALSLMVAGSVAGALWLGGSLVATETLTPARAALALFVALALAETLAPLRRALAERGRIREAASRIAPLLAEAPAAPAAPPAADPVLRLEAVTFARATTPLLRDITLTLAPGDRIAIAGPSGSGKSTLLHLAAGLIAPTAGRITLGGAQLVPGDVTLVSQRSALLQASIAENLRLAAPEAPDADLWQVLDAVQLAGVVRARGGLDARLGPRGAGLSGGEARRLALARALLRRPTVLLLDEPAAGLDPATARATLHGLAAALPRAAMLIAAHRAEELAFAGRVLKLTPEGQLDATNATDSTKMP